MLDHVQGRNFWLWWDTFWWQSWPSSLFAFSLSSQVFSDVCQCLWVSLVLAWNLSWFHQNIFWILFLYPNPICTVQEVRLFSKGLRKAKGVNEFSDNLANPPFFTTNLSWRRLSLIFHMKDIRLSPAGLPKNGWRGKQYLIRKFVLQNLEK